VDLKLLTENLACNGQHWLSLLGKEKPRHYAKYLNCNSYTGEKLALKQFSVR